MPGTKTIYDVIKEGLPHGPLAANLRSTHEKIYAPIIGTADDFAEMILEKGGTGVAVFDENMSGRTEEALAVFYFAYNKIDHALRAAQAGGVLPQDMQQNYDLPNNLSKLLVKSAHSIAGFYERTLPHLSSVLEDTRISLPVFRDADLDAAGTKNGALQLNSSVCFKQGLIDAFRMEGGITKPQSLRHDRNVSTEDIIIGQIRQTAGPDGDEIIKIWKDNYNKDIMGRNLLTYGKRALYLAIAQVDPLSQIPAAFQDPVCRLMRALEHHPLSNSSTPAPGP